MAQLFLSYAREDRECAERLAHALTDRGWTVWWDRHIRAGHSFSHVIEQELERSACVIVLWSRHSVASEWVQSEAAEAARRKVLVPVRIEDVRPPLEFRRLQTADLLDWRTGFDTPGFAECLAALERFAPKPPFPTTDTDILIQQDGRQFRAPDFGTLRLWAEAGRVRADSSVYDPAKRRWIAARDLRELAGVFAPAPGPVDPPAEPQQRAGRNYWPFAIAFVATVVVLATIIALANAEWPTESDTTDTWMGDTMTPHPVATAPLPTAISLANGCSDTPIYVAICYRHPQGQWISTGWRIVPPNGMSTNIVYAVGPAVYFYGNGQFGAPLWQGTDREAMNCPVHPTNPFDGPVDQLRSHGFTDVPFFKRTIPPGQPAYTETFNCG